MDEWKWQDKYIRLFNFSTILLLNHISSINSFSLLIELIRSNELKLRIIGRHIQKRDRLWKTKSIKTFKIFIHDRTHSTCRHRRHQFCEHLESWREFEVTEKLRNHHELTTLHAIEGSMLSHNRTTADESVLMGSCKDSRIDCNQSTLTSNCHQLTTFAANATSNNRIVC
jgi:hypothetical protein